MHHSTKDAIAGRPRRATARLLALIVLVASCAADAPGSFEPVPGVDVEPEVAEFVVLVNQYRESIGCPALDWDADVARVAQVHSEDMVERHFFAHTNPDGATPGNRLDEAGIDWSRWAENIAYGYMSAEAVLDGWLNSPGHRQNIENCALLRHGVGLDGSYWTHVFMTP